MLVLHACWRGEAIDGATVATGAATVGRVGIWAEDSTSPAEARRRPGRIPKVRPHPFAAAADALHTALALGAGDATVSTATLVLPTRDDAPVASPELPRDDIGRPGPLTAASWLVPALTLDTDTLLALFRGPGVTADEVMAVPGPSLAHLVELAGFATDLVNRGRLLPSVDIDGPRAVWRPVLTGPDGAWARVLAQSAPSVLLAAADPADRHRAWAQILDALVDAAARAALSRPAPGVAEPGRAASRRPTRTRSTAPRLAIGRSGDTVTRAWLSALSGAGRRFAVTSEQAAALAESLRQWQSDAVADAVRACFRLVEPEAGSEDWQVRFGLQASDEPSLTIDAAAVWRSRGKLSALARQIDAPQEALLGQLGRAARLYPELDESLRTARPSHLQLATDGAHRFLTTVAPTLSTAGFGVQLPGWWTKPSSRLGLRITAKTAGQPGRVEGAQAGLGFAALAQFRYDLALGGQVLTEKELADLADLKAPMVRLRGEWVELDPKRLAAGLRLIGRDREATVGELLRLGMGIDTAADGLPVEGIEADGWLGDLLSGRSEERLTPVQPPRGFIGSLRPYQSRGLAWLDFLHRCGLGGILADDMGLGKTVQLLALLAHDAGTGPSLLICPMSLVGNWQREAARFTPDLRVHVHHGRERARGKHFVGAVAASDLVVTTYALAARDAPDLRTITWRRVVVDEAQAIKNGGTRQAIAIRTLPSATRIAVTGTPVENRLADLWSILEFANPGQLGTATAFRKRFAEPIERHGDEDAANRLRRFTGPFVLRRVKTDRSIIADLPDKLEMDVVCNLTAEQAALYQAVVDDMLERIEQTDGIQRRGLVLATMTKLKQVCNHPAQFLRDGSRLTGRSGKLEALEEILDEVLAVGEKALLFTQFAEFGALLCAYLTTRFGREVLFLHGGVGKAGRDQMVTRFQTDDRAAPPLFVLSLKAGGTGLTLTAANHVVHVDRWWNPAVEDQATDRAFRIGQRRSVQVRKFVCAGTIEEKIAAMIRDKRGLAARIVGTGEQWLTELSSGQLAELFRLEAGAVVE